MAKYDKAAIVEILKKKFSDSDEDLADLGTIMDALEGIEKAEALEEELATIKLENEKALADLDKTWRTRYRDRFFNGDSALEDVIDVMENAEEEDDKTDITIEEYLENLEKEEKK